MAKNCLIKTMTYKTLKGYTYVVTASEAVTITDSNGLVLEVPAGEQRPFTATTTEVTYSAPCTITQVRGNFSIPPAGGGGGGQIVIDPTPTHGSTNAVSSGGVFDALTGGGDGASLATGGYLPLDAGVAPYVAGNVTFSGSVVFSNQPTAKGIILRKRHFNDTAQACEALLGDGWGGAVIIRGSKTGGLVYGYDGIYVGREQFGFDASQSASKFTHSTSKDRLRLSFIERVNNGLVVFGNPQNEARLAGTTISLQAYGTDSTDTGYDAGTRVTLDKEGLAKLQDLIDNADALLALLNS